MLLDILQEPEHQHNADNNENHDNLDHNDNIHNDNVDDNDDDNVDIDNVNNIDNIDNHNVDNVDDNNEIAEDAGARAEVEVGIEVNQGVEEDDPLPGGSGRRSREEDGQDVEEGSSKRPRWWEEFDCTSDSDTDRDDNNTDKNTGNCPVKHGAEVAEEDPLPGPSRERSRKHDKVEDERSSSKKSRRCYEFADSNSDSTVRTGQDHDAHSSSNIDLGENAVEKTDEEVNQQVEEDDPQPGGSRERSGEGDEQEQSRGSKQFKRYYDTDNDSDCD